MMSNLRAIIIGNNHDNTLNVIRALGEVGYKPVLVLVSDKAKNYIIKSRYIDKIYIVTDEYKAKDLLLENNDLWGLPLITTYDKATSVLDESYSLLAKHYSLPNCNHTDSGILNEMDKARMNIVAKSSGMNIPQTISITKLSFDPKEIDNFNYPVILKPEKSISGSKEDFRVCVNKESLIYEVSQLPGHTQFLIQEFIPNDEVLLIAGCVTRDGRNICHGHINKSKHGKENSNLGMNSYGFLSSETLQREEINQYLKVIKYTGPYSFEFIRTNGKLYFIEINLRTDGLYFFYSKAGINIPALWIDDYYRKKRKSEIRKLITYGMCEFQYIKNYVKPKNFVSNIKDFMMTDVFSIASWKDPKPFIFKLIYH